MHEANETPHGRPESGENDNRFHEACCFDM